jgi:hypothetical protein
VGGGNGVGVESAAPMPPAPVVDPSAMLRARKPIRPVSMVR